MQGIHSRRSIEGIYPSGEFSQLEGELQVSRSGAPRADGIGSDQERRRDSKASHSNVKMRACMTTYGFFFPFVFGPAKECTCTDMMMRRFP